MDKGTFNNHMDKTKWVGGLKFAIFVHVWYIKMFMEIGIWSNKSKIDSL